jgi:hypothetical protein
MGIGDKAFRPFGGAVNAAVMLLCYTGSLLGSQVLPSIS